MYGTSKEKQLENLKINVRGKERLAGDRVTCFIRPDDTVKSDNRFVLELTQDWESILNTEKTGIHYYDDKVKGLRLVAEGFQDLDGNPIEDSKGSGKITASKDIELKRDDSKPYIVTQKLIYDKAGINGLQKAGSLGIVFNEPIQLYTKEMAEEGVIAPVIYSDHNPLTPSPTQIGIYENFLPELKAYYEKLDDKGNTSKDETGKPIVVEGKYDLMADILPSDCKANKQLENITVKISDIPHKFDLDPNTSGINKFRDYGLFYINPKVSLEPGNWRLVVSGVSDDAGNEMEIYKSKSFEIKNLFTVETLNKDEIKIKFTEPFNKKIVGDDKVILVITQYGEIVKSVAVENLKDGQTEAEVKFPEPIEDFEGEYFINNIYYKVK
ncbi:hypothetical protein FDF74_00920 [Clostridium niameyense]|uniref:Uncharacterized protein n=1 Tax=Clostridium niameyense TaxID=1622073 RepID=A0A6M0R7L5_9CLOT|nr:hypothetical protein [Clostridium niameyense]NEZ45767.1 hypothetical protein [Clostridium niameyense]